MYRVLDVMLAMLLGAVAARASPWWATWEDGWPEEQGWTRWSSDPPAERWLEDGKLFIDSRAAWGISDIYGQLRPGEMTLGPDQTFVMHWRVMVDDVIPAGHTDPGLQASSDDQWDVIFTLGMDNISSFYEPGKWAPFAPGMFHDFLFESTDMRTYSLSIDGTAAFEGTFFESLFYGPGVGWGDVTTDRSLSEWDFMECGIVPEPDALLCMLAGLCICGLLRRSAAR